MLQLLFAALIASVAVQTVSADFLQDEAFKAYFPDTDAEVSNSWEKLPFSFSKDSPVTKKGKLMSTETCMYYIDGGVIYGSAVKSEVPSMESLDSPYEAWAKVGDTGFGDADIMVDAAWTYKNISGSAAYILTNNNIAVVSLSSNGGCGTIDSSSVILSDDAVFEWGEVTSMDLSVSLQTLFVGSFEKGAFSIDLSSDKPQVEEVRGNLLGGPVKTLKWVEQWSTLYVSNPVALFTITMSRNDAGKTIVNDVYHEWIGGVLGTRVVDIDFDPVNNFVWLAEKEALHKLSKEGIFFRYGWQQGAPMFNITSVVLANGMVYAGSDSGFGMSRVSASACPKQLDITVNGDSNKDKSTDPWTWQYYYNARYLPSNQVLSLVSDKRVNAKHSILVMTDAGLTYLRAEYMNLEEKARAMQTFQKPRHDRHGLISPINLAEFGDLSTYVQPTNDNDGLWTSMSVMGLAYRYAVSKKEGDGKGNAEAKQLAWEGFEALERLSHTTGAYPAFVARSICELDVDTDCPVVDPDCVDDCWYDSPKDGWIYKGDTSSDELCGHFAAYGLLYDVVAETTEEKDRVLNLMEGLLMGIIDNDLYLIQPATGKRTLWGFWNPHELNYEPEHYSERGTNSLEILSWLTQAYSITGNRKYKEQYETLVKHHKYVENTYNVKIDSEVDENHSDTELLMLAYHSLFYAYQRLDDNHPRKSEVLEMVKPIVPSLEKTWILLQGELSPLWFGIYAGTAQQTKHVDESSAPSAVATLQRWTIDLIDWEVEGSQRIDLDFNQHFTARYSTLPVMRHIRPPSERRAQEWNSDPFSVSPGGQGTGEYEPGTWLLPYYIMKYNDLIPA